MSKQELADGIFWNAPSDKAPDFVLGNVSIAPAKFMPWLEQQQTNDKGYVRLQVLMSKAGRPYLKLDTYEPKQGGSATPPARGRAIEIDAEAFGNDESIPF